MKAMVEKDQLMKMIDKRVEDITEDQWDRLNRRLDALKQNEVKIARRKLEDELRSEVTEKLKEKDRSD